MAKKRTAKKRPKKTGPKTKRAAKTKPAGAATRPTANRNRAAGDAHRKRAADYARRIREASREIGAIPDFVDPKRRARAAGDLRYHLETYHPNAFRLGWCADHLELIDDLQNVIQRGGKKSVAMPRGSGKTTIVVRAISWALLHGLRRFAVFLAATDPKAVDAADQLKTELETNQLLLEDFPEIAFPVRCLQSIANRAAGQTCQGKPTSISWGRDELVFPTIEGAPASGSILKTGGLLSSVSRGPQHILNDGTILRPDICLIDDPSTRQSAKSPTQNQFRLDTIEADVAGMAGPSKSLACIATVTIIAPGDAADQLTDRDRFPHWLGTRKRFLRSFPDNLDRWDEYAEILRQSLRTHNDYRLATAFYKKHRREMDKGADVSWPERFERDSGEISAVQHAMNWFILRPAAFWSELQNDPQRSGVDEKRWVDAPTIAAKTHHVGRLVVPAGCSLVVRHVDVHEDLLYHTTAAFAGDREQLTAFVIDYGTFPEQPSRYFQKREATKTLARRWPKRGVDGALAAGLEQLLAESLEARFDVEGESGDELQLGLIGIDNGHKNRIVDNAIQKLANQYRCNACGERHAGRPAAWPDCDNCGKAGRGQLVKSDAGRRLVRVRGFGVGPGDRPFAERKLDDGDRLGNHLIRKKRVAGESPLLWVDVNYWKEKTADRWSAAFGQIGCCSLYAGGDHQGFSEHQTAELADKQTSGRTGRTVFCWRDTPTDNHWLDNVVGVHALASLTGIDTPAEMVAPVKPAKRTAGRRRRPARRKRRRR